ncbi:MULTISPECIES: flavin reductase [unclassified Sedimentibacter]|uniref:flavin reductase n=1 Tax=unclassified Sedimentibacter TaxID=2649220 RepID=UPI0027E158D2|nr:flavin reductase [Sedimentibacter sp. MB35-C1]WMJ75981.1 flavin reductase [Sedimentibacter sp. MB35-C1]
MNNFIEIKPEELNNSPFKMIGSDWMLVTAEKDSKINTMTASWGGLGVMWNKDVSFIVIRPTRYTKEFIDNSDRFSLAFFNNSFKKQLTYLGTVSGRSEDKVSKSGLTTEHFNGTPYFSEADTVIICKKLYSQKFGSEFFIENSLDEVNYPNKDYHTLYISEVENIFVKKDK